MTKLERLPTSLVSALEGAGYVLRKPITTARLAELATAAGSLPEGVIRYLATSDGLEHAELYGIEGSEGMLKPSPSSSLLPLREDGSGNYDSVIIEPGPAFGAVVFWDHETTEASDLVASSVPMYLELLVGVTRGRKNREDFLRAHDAGAARLLDDPQFRTFAGRTFTVELQQPGPDGALPEGTREGINPFTKKREVFLPRQKYRSPPKQR